MSTGTEQWSSSRPLLVPYCGNIGICLIVELYEDGDFV
jgi:hypothetical protein